MIPTAHGFIPGDGQEYRGAKTTSNGMRVLARPCRVFIVLTALCLPGNAGWAQPARQSGIAQISAAADSSVVSPAPAALDRFAMRKTATGYLTATEFLAFVGTGAVGSAAAAFTGRGLLAVLGLVLAGGFALNLTPCVLPLIPVNLAILGAGKTAVSRTRGLLLGAAYGGAMALVYGGLGLVVMLTSRAFGAVNASPWFNAAIAALFVLLALSMFEVFFLDLSRYSSRLRFASARGSVGLAITMGGVAALLAGACVAPVVVQVIVFSSSLYASGTKAALALPFVLGLGMAAPWPFAGAGMAALPRPGAWMIRVKQVLGVAILLLAAFYAHTAYRLFADRSPGRAPSAAGASADGWTSLEQALAIAERERRPVFVDLWATWCKDCLAMDQTTFEDARVKAALAAGYVRANVQAEDPDDPRVRAILDRFGAIGLPTYVVLDPLARDGGLNMEREKR
jgi:thiol:disulfide interchange protein